MVEVALSNLKVLLQTLHLQPKLQILPMQAMLIKMQVVVAVATNPYVVTARSQAML